jgi:GMP synthase (glutamine-hydrolysing)
VLGICLGAQLLAAAAGARVYPNVRPGPDGRPAPAREVGWGPIDLVDAEREPLWAGLPARPLVLHWHGDTFDLPPGAVHLASTPVCRHQAFRLGRRQVGLQFHCELDTTTIATWVREDADYVRDANGPDGGARILADTERVYAAARPLWDRLLGNVFDVLGC